MKSVCHSDFLHISHTFLIIKQNVILDKMKFSMIIYYFFRQKKKREMYLVLYVCGGGWGVGEEEE